jgi:hypothetical protein
MMSGSDWMGLRVEFDDERVVSDAGVMLVATLAERLGSRRWRADWCTCVGTGQAQRPRGAR